MSAIGRSGHCVARFEPVPIAGWVWLVLLFDWIGFTSRWLDRWRWFWSELGKLPQVLSGGSEQELVLRPAWTS